MNPGENVGTKIYAEASAYGQAIKWHGFYFFQGTI
jgi:hypothetical protein